ncbi:adenosylcobinamide-GDP ribazoletransferase [Calderihabitans maritimus]|uniref:Adenosylcobinamide-GDP ribazoletransferase n=1 Tax=Calderihabitans maritimus TaxID=1246530 RepID=A0A1Z5HP97_9FIRM|nr:adenosylcobinamide-GDP ribazoletransferase [Calderihabitans maritimus]GAW91207.1 cobalamin 5'-phosphate synthase [Calderihabitans maritimus]
MEFLLALQFLTRVPVTIRSPVETRNLGRAAAYFPLIGLLIGIFSAVLYTLLTPFLTTPVSDLMVIVFQIVVTGNMHIDGLMDAADGLFSGKPREKVLEIMKDSRVGAHGVTAGCLVLLAKFVLWGQIPAAVKGEALVLVPVLGRWAQVYAATFYPYVGKGSGAGSYANYLGNREIVLASLFTLGTIMFLLGLKGSLLAGAVLSGTAILGLYVSKRIGGITGDILGALNECVEVLGLLILQFLG